MGDSMENEEILKAVKVIGYDKDKHCDIKEALKEFMSIPRYNNVMRGIVANEEDLNTVKEVMKYYKLLKEIDIAEINKLLDDDEENENDLNVISDEEDEVNKVRESIAYKFRDRMFLKVKNNVTMEYETVLEASEIKSHKYYVTTSDGIYNLLGKKLFGKYKSVRNVSDKIIEIVDLDDNTIYVSTDGKKCIDKNTYNNMYDNITKILSSSNLNYDVLNKFFDYLIDGRKLEYLKYNILSIVDDYVYCYRNSEVVYFNISGEVVLTTEDYVYSYISNLAFDEYQDCYNRLIKSEYKTERNKKSHIVIVGKYDDKFKIKYGLYDLDLKKEILKPSYNAITYFCDFVAVGYNKKEAFLLVKDDTGVVNCFNMTSQFKKNSIDIHNICDCFRLSEDSCFLVGLDDLRKKNIVLVINNIFKSPNLAYALDEFQYSCHFSLDNYSFIEGLKLGIFEYYLTNFDRGYKRETHYIKIVDSRGNCENLNLRYIMNHIGDDNPYEKIYQTTYPMLPKYIQNSNYMLPFYRENSRALMCLTDKKKNEIIKRELSELANTKVNNDLANVISKNLKNVNDSLNYQEYYYNLSDLKPTDNSNFLVGRIDRFSYIEEILINIADKVVIKNSDFKIKRVDEIGNIVIEVKFGNGHKQCLINGKGELLIDYSDLIEGPADGVYVVTNRGVKQCYLNGLPISYCAEQINILDKYICDSNGCFIEEKKSIIIGNKGNYSIIDDDNDIVLIQDESTLKLKQMFEDIDLLKIDEESIGGYEKRK